MDNNLTTTTLLAMRPQLLNHACGTIQGIKPST